MRIAFRLVAALMASVSVSFAQAPGPVPLTTGREAAASFQYQGRPVHPLCVSFAFDSARRTPHMLAQCTDPKLTPAAKPDGWLELNTEQPASWVNYRVLARKGPRFLITTDVRLGGVTGTTDLLWVRLESDRVSVDEDVVGGQSCSGGLSEFAGDGARAIRFSANMTSSDIVALAAPARAEEATKGLSSAILSDCAGYATYRYDLERETMTLATVTLMRPTPGTTTSSDANRQNCFERLVAEQLEAKTGTLTPSQLTAFGQTFLEKCRQLAPK